MAASTASVNEFLYVGSSMFYLGREYFNCSSIRLKGNGYRRGKKINPHLMGYVMGVMQSPWL